MGRNTNLNIYIASVVDRKSPEHVNLPIPTILSVVGLKLEALKATTSVNHHQVP